MSNGVDIGAACQSICQGFIESTTDLKTAKAAGLTVTPSGQVTLQGDSGDLLLRRRIRLSIYACLYTPVYEEAYTPVSAFICAPNNNT